MKEELVKRVAELEHAVEEAYKFNSIAEYLDEKLVNNSVVLSCYLDNREWENEGLIQSIYFGEMGISHGDYKLGTHYGSQFQITIPVMSIANVSFHDHMFSRNYLKLVADGNIETSKSVQEDAKRNYQIIKESLVPMPLVTKPEIHNMGRTINKHTIDVAANHLLFVDDDIPKKAMEAYREFLESIHSDTSVLLMRV